MRIPSAVRARVFRRAVHLVTAGHPLPRAVLGRVATGVALVLVTSMLVFAGTELLPGDAATAALGQTATPEQLRVVRERLGLDDPAPRRYADWLGGLVRGDLGVTVSGRPVADVIAGKAVNTLALALVTAALLIAVALGLGLTAGARAGSVTDRLISAAAVGAMALPEFVIGTLLIIVFALWLGLLPSVSLLPAEGALGRPAALVLPVLTLSAGAAGHAIRLVRAAMAEVMASPYIPMARLHGIPERRVLVRHALRNALAPTVQLFAAILVWLVGGIAVVERVFGYPGLSQVLVDAVATRDIPLVQSLATIFAALTVSLYIAADIVVTLLIPKLRTAA
ncbi:MAG: ABC transporter permease [Egibacteraceae bacterium]